MRALLPALLLVAVSAVAWECPQCGSENQDSFCSECHLPEPPDGMIFVPSCSVEINGETVEVSRFFIDASPVSYRDIIPWLNNSGFGARELGAVITGGGSEAMEFLAFTPFVGDEGGGITVPSQCLENPAASITWSGAQSFLSEEGKRLPTLGELYAAYEAGILDQFDAYESMLAFSDQLRATMGEMLGTLSTQAMFAGYSTARERIMWELTGTEWGGDPMNRAPSPGVSYISILKPGNSVDVTSVHRDNGYFNIIFRGAIEVPE